MMLEMERDDFCRMFNEMDPEGLIADSFEDCGPLFETESYLFHNNPCGDVSIIDKYSLDKVPRVINWYKLYHVGRCLNLHGFLRGEDVREMIGEIVEELRERREKWVGMNNK